MPTAFRDELAPAGSSKHRRVGGLLVDGAALTNATPVSVIVKLGNGVARWRLHFQATCAGSLTFRYVRPLKNQSLYTAGAPGGAPAAAAVVANVETIVTVQDHAGEQAVQVTFTPSANGAVTFADLSAQIYWP